MCVYTFILFIAVDVLVNVSIYVCYFHENKVLEYIFFVRGFFAVGHFAVKKMLVSVRFGQIRLG